MQNEIQEIKNLLEHLLAREKDGGKTILSFNEAIAYMDISKSFLYKLTSQGKITHFKPNNKLIYFRKTDLDQFLQRNKFNGE